MRERESKIYWGCFFFLSCLIRESLFRKLEAKGPLDLRERRVKVMSLGGRRGGGESPGVLPGGSVQGLFL